jgi:hypothetical protein
LLAFLEAKSLNQLDKEKHMTGHDNDPQQAQPSEFDAFDDRVNATLERLGESGWVLGGGYDSSQVLGFGFDLVPDYLRDSVEEAALALRGGFGDPIRDEEGELVDGFWAGTDEETGHLSAEYRGPADERFERVVDAMIDIVDPMIKLPRPEEYGTGERPGYRLLFNPSEYVIGQQLENGFSVTWTTEKTPVEVMEDYLAGDTEGMSATVGIEKGEEERSLDSVEVSDLLDFLRSHDEDKIFYVKLRKSDDPDYVVFANNKGVHEVGVLGPMLTEEDAERVIKITSAMTASGTFLVRKRIGYVFGIMAPVMASEAA